MKKGFIKESKEITIMWTEHSRFYIVGLTYVHAAKPRFLFWWSQGGNFNYAPSKQYKSITGT